MSTQLTESLEDYLEAIAELIEIEGHAHTKGIAERLGVRMPSVTNVLKLLEQKGYIIYTPRYPVVLTPKGKAAANLVINRHNILTRFFSGIFGIPLEKSSEIACRVEHSIDEENIGRFLLFSEAIHNRADARELRTFLTEAMDDMNRCSDRRHRVLSEMQIGDRAEFRSFSRNLDGREKPDFAPGDSIMILRISLDRSYYTLLHNGRETEIPQSIAENTWVKVVEQL